MSKQRPTHVLHQPQLGSSTHVFRGVPPADPQRGVWRTQATTQATYVHGYSQNDMLADRIISTLVPTLNGNQQDTLAKLGQLEHSIQRLSSELAALRTASKTQSDQLDLQQKATKLLANRFKKLLDIIGDNSHEARNKTLLSRLDEVEFSVGDLIERAKDSEASVPPSVYHEIGIETAGEVEWETTPADYIDVGIDPHTVPNKISPSEYVSVGVSAVNDIMDSSKTDKRDTGVDPIEDEPRPIIADHGQSLPKNDRSVQTEFTHETSPEVNAPSAVDICQTPQRRASVLSFSAHFLTDALPQLSTSLSPVDWTKSKTASPASDNDTDVQENYSGRTDFFRPDPPLTTSEAFPTRQVSSPFSAAIFQNPELDPAVQDDNNCNFFSHTSGSSATSVSFPDAGDTTLDPHSYAPFSPEESLQDILKTLSGSIDGDSMSEGTLTGFRQDDMDELFVQEQIQETDASNGNLTPEPSNSCGEIKLKANSLGTEHQDDESLRHNYTDSLQPLPELDDQFGNPSADTSLSNSDLPEPTLVVGSDYLAKESVPSDPGSVYGSQSESSQSKAAPNPSSSAPASPGCPRSHDVVKQEDPINKCRSPVVIDLTTPSQPSPAILTTAMRDRVAAPAKSTLQIELSFDAPLSPLSSMSPSPLPVPKVKQDALPSSAPVGRPVLKRTPLRSSTRSEARSESPKKTLLKGGAAGSAATRIKKRKPLNQSVGGLSIPPLKRARSRKTLFDSVAEEVQWPTKNESDNGFVRKVVRCDGCWYWFHYGCVGIVPGDSRLKANRLFSCPICSASPATIEQRRRRSKREGEQGYICARPDCSQSDKPQEYFVDGIIGRRPLDEKTGAKPQYIWLVRWSGYTISEATWETEANMADPEVLIEKFYEAARKEGFKVETTPIILLGEAVKGGW